MQVCMYAWVVIVLSCVNQQSYSWWHDAPAASAGRSGGAVYLLVASVTGLAAVEHLREQPPSLPWQKPAPRLIVPTEYLSMDKNV